MSFTRYSQLSEDEQEERRVDTMWCALERVSNILAVSSEQKIDIYILYVHISVKDSHVILYKQGKNKIGSKSQEKKIHLFYSYLPSHFFGALK